MAVEQQKIKQLVEEVVNKVLAQVKPVEDRPVGGRQGVFETMDQAIDAAEGAQIDLMSLSMETRAQMIQALRQAGLNHGQDFARRTIEETGMGRLQDKQAKFRLVAEKTPGTEDLITLSWSGDHGLTIVEMAPYGVIGAITPSTHPVPTLLNNAISFIAAGNSGVFNAHPATNKVFAYAVDIFNSAIMEAGGPPNLITTIANPTIATAQQLFVHPKIRLLLVTGGPGVVKAAMQAAKKVVAAGPGNPPVVVDETADIPKAARDIIAGAAFDNNIVCISEKEVFVVEQVADQLKAEMLKRGAYELSRHQIDQLAQRAFIAQPDSTLMVSRDLVGRNASVLAAAIGLEIDPDTRLLIGETDFDHPFVQEEQLMPFLPIVRCKEINQAIDLSIKAEHGYGHTAVIHSRNIENMSKMAHLINTSIFIKNGPSYAGLGVGGEGYTSFSIASPTGEGITSARSFTRPRRCTLVDYFRII